MSKPAGKVTRVATRLLELLRASDKPLSRDELAALQGKSQLNYHEVDMLNRLVDYGLVKVEVVKVGIRDSFRYTAAKAL
jgi:predicted transcriptional regulator